MDPLEIRVSRLESWRDKVDEERGQIMRELGELTGLLTPVSEQLKIIGYRLDAIQEKLEERPSKVELMRVEEGLKSVRAKAKVSVFELFGPMGWKLKLFGFSGFTVFLIFCLVASIGIFWIVVTRK